MGYIKYDLRNPIASSKFALGLMESINLLKDFPYVGLKRQKSGCRIKIYKNFLVYYEIREQEKLIIIKRVIHRNINI